MSKIVGFECPLITINTYDELGNIKTITQKDVEDKDLVTTYNYDESNQLESVVNDLNEKTSYTYDVTGNMLTQENALGHITSYEYNTRGLLTSTYDHGGKDDPTKTTSYSYYSDGTLKTKTDKNQTTFTYTYDIQGRLLSEIAVKATNINPSNADATITYIYTDEGHIETMTDTTGTTSRTFDELGRVTSKTVPEFGTVTYEYDKIEGLDPGQYAEVTRDPKDNVTKKVYDQASRLIEVWDGTEVTSYQYYDNGQRKEVLYPDGSSESYVYDEENQLVTLTNKNNNNQVINVYNYTYDNAGNQLTKTETLEGVDYTTVYAYDSLNRLNTVTEPSRVSGVNKVTETNYTYDPIGNRDEEIVKTTLNGVTNIRNNIYKYNDQNQLIKISTYPDLDVENSQLAKEIVYEFDNNGNQVKVTEIDSQNPDQKTVTDYTYDVFNQLIQVRVTSSEGITTSNYTYNGEGRRVSKNMSGIVTHYLYEYDKVVLEANVALLETARNIYGLNLIKRLTKDNNESYYYMYNGHADVVALLDVESGSVVATYYYDAFGVILEQAGSINNSISYAGYQYDEETGLYYLNSRMYDPMTARFLQEDTYKGQANDPLSLNLYTYCGNNPIVYWDPSGHMAVVSSLGRGTGFEYIPKGSRSEPESDLEKVIDMYKRNVAYYEELEESTGAGYGDASYIVNEIKWKTYDITYNFCTWYVENAKYIPVVNYGNSFGQGIYEISQNYYDAPAGAEFYFEHNKAGYLSWQKEFGWSTGTTIATLATFKVVGLRGSEATFLEASVSVKMRMDEIGSLASTGIGKLYDKIFGKGAVQPKTWRGTKVVDGTTYVDDIGAFGEHIAEDMLMDNGWTDFTYIKNASDNGIDIIARGPNGQLGIFEVKTSSVGSIPNLSPRQQSMNYFVDDILSNAANGTGRYSNIDEATQFAAQELYDEFLTNPGNVSGNVIGVDIKNGAIQISRWER